MKFTVNKNDIRDLLAKVQGLTGCKTNLAITETVLIKIQEEESGMTLLATDLETGLEGRYPAEVESGGAIAIHARKLFEIVKEFPNDAILIHEEDARWIRIGDEKVEYHIGGLDPDDFPEEPRIEDAGFIRIDGPAFSRMIDKTVGVSGPTDDKRAHIKGVLFETVKKDDQPFVRIVSTDGSRLVLIDAPYQENPDPDHDNESMSGILVPKKGLQEINKFLNVEGTVEVGVKDNNFIVRKETETLTVRLLEGDFPDYRGIISRDPGNLIDLDRKDFTMMLRRMAILSSDTYKSVVFNIRENLLSVTTTNPDVGESKEDMEIFFEEEPIEVAFNPRNFIELLGLIEEDVVALDLIDEKKPCLLRGKAQTDLTTVIMPMKI